MGGSTNIYNIASTTVAKHGGGQNLDPQHMRLTSSCCLDLGTPITAFASCGTCFFRGTGFWNGPATWTLGPDRPRSARLVSSRELGVFRRSRSRTSISSSVSRAVGSWTSELGRKSWRSPTRILRSSSPGFSPMLRSLETGKLGSPWKQHGEGSFSLGNSTHVCLGHPTTACSFGKYMEYCNHTYVSNYFRLEGKHSHFSILT